MNDPLAAASRSRRTPLSRGSQISSSSFMTPYTRQSNWRGETFGANAGAPSNPTPAPAPAPAPRPRVPLTRVAPDQKFTGQNTSVLTTAPSASAGGTITRNGMTRAYAPTPASAPSMNSGGTITRNGVVTDVAASPYAPSNADPSRPNAGGTMQRTGMTPVAVPQSPSVTPSPVSPNVQQTERANPLSGAISPQPQGTSAPINPLGMTQRGTSTPNGDDATSMGTGIFDRTFRNRRAAEDPYAGMVRSLFGSAGG